VFEDAVAICTELVKCEPQLVRVVKAWWSDSWVSH